MFHDQMEGHDNLETKSILRFGRLNIGITPSNEQYQIQIGIYPADAPGPCHSRIPGCRHAHFARVSAAADSALQSRPRPAERKASEITVMRQRQQTDTAVPIAPRPLLLAIRQCPPTQYPPIQAYHPAYQYSTSPQVTSPVSSTSKSPSPQTASSAKTTTVSRRKSYTTAACETCRKRKVKVRILNA